MLQMHNNIFKMYFTNIVFSFRYSAIGLVASNKQLTKGTTYEHVS